jgi:hypothetical protein
MLMTPYAHFNLNKAGYNRGVRGKEHAKMLKPFRQMQINLKKGQQTWHINKVFYIMCPQSNSKEDKHNHTMSKDSIDETSTTTTTKMNKMSRIKILAHLV